MRNFALLLILLLTLNACDLFRLRDSEAPTKPADWNNYTTSWDLCLQNLEYCYQDSRNGVKYGTLFAADYQFWFSAQDVNDYGLSPTWDKNQEQDMLLNLHSQSDSLRLTLTPLTGQVDEISANEARIYRRYDLTRYHSSLPVPALYSGNLELLFRKTGGFWYLAKWYDYRAYSHPTWGKLKYDFSQ
ncbi:MAG TPA: hypothetical protein PKH19_03400 [Candidatus Syntrophosphaera sp.]|nr:hypothetical protein [Candidatus Syntrophosphaera sp.]